MLWVRTIQLSYKEADTDAKTNQTVELPGGGN
jgi:hypothetical protein